MIAEKLVIAREGVRGNSLCNCHHSDRLIHLVRDLRIVISGRNKIKDVSDLKTDLINPLFEHRYREALAVTGCNGLLLMA